jgi:hypothetical protein
MILLRYNGAKLLLAAGLLLLFLIPLALIFLYPEELVQSRRGFVRLLGSGFGHDVFVPLLIGACLVLMWRLVATAMGSLVAIEAREDSIRVTDMWGTQHIAWARLAPIEVERTSAMGSTNNRLIFRGGRRAAKVPVGMTDSADTPIHDLLIRIETLRCGARRPEAPRRPEVRAPAAAQPAGFGRKRS